MFDFNNVEAAQGAPNSNVNYLNPGMYELKLTKVEAIISSQKGTPGMECIFTCKSSNLDFNDGIIKAKFYITPKSMPRLQYLHEGLTGTPISKIFTSAEEISAYFESIVPVTGYKKMVAGGSISEKGIVYSDLSYSGFFVTNENDYEEGEYDVNSKLYQGVITSKIKTVTSGGSNGGSDDGDMFSTADDSPF